MAYSVMYLKKSEQEIKTLPKRIGKTHNVLEFGTWSIIGLDK